MLFGDSCVACAGPGAALDVNGVCHCAQFAILIENAADGTAVCQCDKNYLPFNDVCIICYGVGAVLENGACTCKNVEGTQFDPLLVGKCICQQGLFTVSFDGLFISSKIVQFGTEKCVQCDGRYERFDEVTGECLNEGTVKIKPKFKISVHFF